MSGGKQKTPRVRQNRKKKEIGIYMKNVLTRKVFLEFGLLGNNIIDNIQKSLKISYEKKCVNEGYIKEDSIRVINYSSGIIRGNNVIFDAVFECMICKPVEGMIIKCQVKNITKAGLRAETKDKISPVIVFIARDHHYKNKEFSKLKADDEISVRVIGVRFELNDEYISLIAELIKNRSKAVKLKIKNVDG